MKIIEREFLKTSTPTVHASTMAFFRGNLAQAWFGGAREGLSDSAIFVQYKGQIKVLKPDFLPTFQGFALPLWNPVLFPINDHLYLFWKAGIFCDRWASFISDISEIETRDLNEMPYQVLPAGLNGPVKTKAIVAKEGRENVIYCGSSVETMINWSAYIERYEMVDGKLKFLNRSNPLTVFGKGKGLIQPAIWDFGVTLHCFMRSDLGKIYYSRLEDNDNNIWSEPIAIQIDNPNASVDVVCVKGRLFLVCNPSSVYRHPLELLELNPKTFAIEDRMVIQDIVSGKLYLSPEFSYPYLIEHDGKIHLTYTYAREKIEHCVISI